MPNPLIFVVEDEPDLREIMLYNLVREGYEALGFESGSEGLEAIRAKQPNLVILDRDGQTMVDADVQVTAITPSNGVRLFQAASRQTYTCAPYCQPSPTLGDSADHIAANSSQAEAAGTPSTIRDTDFSNFGTVSDVVSGRSLRGGP